MGLALTSNQHWQTQRFLFSRTFISYCTSLILVYTGATPQNSSFVNFI